MIPETADCNHIVVILCLLTVYFNFLGSQSNKTPLRVKVWISARITGSKDALQVVGGGKCILNCSRPTSSLLYVKTYWLTHTDQSEAEEVTRSHTPYTLLVGLHRRDELLEWSLQQTSTLTQILTLSTWMTRFSTSLYVFTRLLSYFLTKVLARPVVCVTIFNIFSIQFLSKGTKKYQIHLGVSRVSPNVYR